MVVVSSTRQSWGDQLRRNLELMMALVRRNIAARYRRSALGPTWAILQPLVFMALFTMLRGIVDIPSDNVPYVIFSFSALVPWTFFTNAVTLSGPSLVSNADLLKKIAVPREIFPAASVTTSLFDLAMASVVLAGMLAWFRVSPGWSFVWLPPLVVLLYLVALGVGLGIASIATYRRDLIFATPILMQFWLFATPIIYPISSVPDKWSVIYRLNPMAGIIDSFRTILMKGDSPDGALLLSSVVGVALIWTVTWPLFKYMSRYASDVL